MEFLSKEGLQYFWQQILGKLNGYVAKSDLNDYVAKEDGKDLSSNDYTTAEKNKLSGIATGAEVNQNAFGIIKTKSGSVNATVNADAKVDTVTFEAGDNITLITNESTGVIKIVGADAPEAPEASLEGLGISASPTEINYLTGASSNIQAQLNSMLDITETGTAITANSDLNNYKTPGNYICVANNTGTLTNCPVSTQGFKLIVITGYSADRYHQILLRGASSDFYYRMYNSTNLEWTDWVNLNTTISLSDLGITATAAELNYVDGVTSSIQTQLNAKVPTSRTVNGKALSSNISLTYSDVDAAPAGYGLGQLVNYSVSNDTEIDNTLTTVISEMGGQYFKRIVLSFTTTTNFTNAGGHYYADIYKLSTNYALITIKSYIQGGRTIQRLWFEGEFKPWEWVNPPLIANIEYRTIERVNNKAVYKKRDSNNKMWYRLDEETTWVEGIPGAAPEEHTHNASDINAGTLAAARLPDISIDKLVAGTTNTTIPSSLLPAYVDDVLEYAAKANFPTTGTAGKIYVDKATNLTYRWSGSAYVEISPSLALGTTSSTAYRGDLGAAAYTHAVTNKGVAKSSGLYKITTNAEGHVTAGTAVTKADITGLGIPGEKSTLSDLGITATAAELNKMDGVTATTTELNYVDGVTSSIQTQLNNRLNLNSTGSAINQNDDLNDYTTPGVYTAVLSTAQTLSNTPCKVGFKLIVMRGYSSNYISQFIFRGNANQWWYRSYSYVNEPIWTDWQSYLPISGGTLTGDLTIDKEYAFLYLANGDGEKVGAFYGSPTEHKPYILSYPSDNSGYYEGYGLPTAATGLTAHKWYSILTTKNKVTAAQGGTGHDFSSIPANAVIRNSGDNTGLWYTTTASGALYATAANGSIKFGTLPIAQGGTGGTTAATALINLGAVNKAGDTMTGNLTVPYLAVQNGDYPAIVFNSGDGVVRSTMQYDGASNHRIYFKQYHSDMDSATTRYADCYVLPTSTAGKTANTWYNILTSKNTVTVAQGGTGGTTAKAAAYNLLNDMTDSTIALTDDSKFVFKLATTASTENGVLMTKSASVIWDYIKSKADSVYSTTDTKVTQTSTENAAKNTNWYILCGPSKTTGARGALLTNDFRVQNFSGTTSEMGEVELILGNNINTGTAGNKQGFITLYSPGTSYHTIKGASITSACAHLLPNKGGTFHTTGSVLYSSTQPTGTYTGQLWLKPV